MKRFPSNIGRGVQALVVPKAIPSVAIQQPAGDQKNQRKRKLLGNSSASKYSHKHGAHHKQFIQVRRHSVEKSPQESKKRSIFDYQSYADLIKQHQEAQKKQKSNGQKSNSAFMSRDGPRPMQTST